MIPSKSLSVIPVPAPYVHGDTHPVEMLVDHEPGGVALNEANQGLFLKIWTLELIGNNVTVSAADVAPVVLFSKPGITEISLAFDGNMAPCVAYVASGAAFLYWFDPTVIGFVHLPIPNAVNPRVTMDDKRDMQVLTRDVILAYLVGTSLYYRQQRDRFTIAYLLKNDVQPDRPLLKVAMNTKLRLQFEFGPPP